MPRKIPVRDFREIRRAMREKRQQLEREVNILKSGRQNLQEQINKLSKWRFIKRALLKRAISKSQAKAMRVNLEARLDTLLQNFKHRTTTAINAFKQAYDDLVDAIRTGEPDNVIAARERDFLEMEGRYKSAIIQAESNARLEIARLIKEYQRD